MPVFSTEQLSDVTDLLGEIGVLEERLLARFSRLDPDQVRRCLRDSRAQFEGARVRNFLAVLVERAATDRLRALEREAGGVQTARAEMNPVRRDVVHLAGSPDSAARIVVDLSGLRLPGCRRGGEVSGRAPA